MSTAYRSTGHTTPDTSHLVWRVADKVCNKCLQVFQAKRQGNATSKKVIDTLALGEAKLKSSSLATFNKRFCEMRDGRTFADKIDILPELALRTPPEDGSADLRVG